MKTFSLLGVSTFLNLVLFLLAQEFFYYSYSLGANSQTLTANQQVLMYYIPLAFINIPIFIFTMKLYKFWKDMDPNG